jgi:hypothetical protein
MWMYREIVSSRWINGRRPENILEEKNRVIEKKNGEIMWDGKAAYQLLKIIYKEVKSFRKTESSDGILNCLEASSKLCVNGK